MLELLSVAGFALLPLRVELRAHLRLQQYASSCPAGVWGMKGVVQRVDQEGLGMGRLFESVCCQHQILLSKLTITHPVSQHAVS